MPEVASGVFRRTLIERTDQRVSWRSDQAFFASGACHILAWVCQESYLDRPIELAAMFLAGERHPLHVYGHSLSEGVRSASRFRRATIEPSSRPKPNAPGVDDVGNALPRGAGSGWTPSDRYRA